MSDGGAMSNYRQQFDYDVFVSYARVDDDRIGRERQGWVTQFHEDLSAQIRVYFGQEVRVWRDNDIRNNEDFEKKIVNRLARAATFLPIVSASFVNSDWCLREVREFSANADKRFGMLLDGEKKRVFKVERIPTDRTILPDELQGTTTYRFFVDGKRPLRPNISDRDGEAYYDRLIDLATDVASAIRSLVKATKSFAKPEDVQPPDPVLSLSGERTGRVVYLAETTYALDDIWAEIRRDLKDRGFTVLPEADLPRRARDYRSQVSNLLARADVAVHLIDGDYGFVPEGEAAKSNVWIQHELALAQAQANIFKQIVWIAKSEETDQRQEAFLEYLRADPIATAQAELLEGNVEELKTEIYDTFGRLESARLASLQARAAAEPFSASKDTAGPAADTTGPRSVYIICSRADRQTPEFIELRRHLLARGLEPLLPTEGENDSETIELHREKLAECDAAIIYYGASPSRWFDVKLNDFRKLLRNRPRPVLARAIYISEPVTFEKQEVETNEAIVLRAEAGFSADVLAPFLLSMGLSA